MLTAYCLVLLLTGTTARLFSTPSTKGHTNSAFAPAPVYNVDGNWKSVEGSGAEPPGSPRLDLLDSCNELYRDTLLDHFSWDSTYERNTVTSVPLSSSNSSGTLGHGRQHFAQRYYTCDQYWSGTGPIFFYFGNEGNVTRSVVSTGLMWESAAEFSALLVFAEHRYYGNSTPFGKFSTTPDHIKYLTMTQAMADYADLLTDLKAELYAESSPVIGFGGSYGGILAAYFRLKYPHIVDGVIASSAPIWMFERPPSSTEELSVSSAFYAQGVTAAAASYSPQCVENTRLAFQQIIALGTSDAKSDQIESGLRLCQAVSTGDKLGSVTALDVANWAASAIIGMAQYNYPVPQYKDGYVLAPAWPLAAACAHLDRADLNSSSDPEDLLSSLADAVEIYYNYGHSVSCNDVPAQSDSYYRSVDYDYWNYQTCTELPWPQSMNGVDDMFWAEPWNRSSTIANCKETWGVEPDFLTASINYGAGRLDSLSNVVFSNGLLDPYHGAGVLHNISDTVVAVVMPEAAHCLDLLFSSPADPVSVTEAREAERRYIHAWVDEYQASGKHWP